MATRDELIKQGFVPEERLTADDLRAAGFEPEGEPADTWRAEASHALARGSFKAAASVPGTAASAVETSPILNIGKLLPSWTPLGALSRVADEPRQEAVRKLRRTATDVYQAASAPSIQPKKGGVGGFILNTMLETAPVLAASTAAEVVAGPVGSFSIGMMTMGEDAAQGAAAKGASTTTQNIERTIVGLVGGAIERMQAGEVLKLGKGSARTIIQAARDRAWKKLGTEVAKLTTEQIIGAASEGLEETLQEATLIGAATLHGEKIATLANAKRLGMAAVGGATAGGLLKGGRTVLGAMTEPVAVTESRPANAPAYQDEPVAEPTAPTTTTMDEFATRATADLPIAKTIPESGPEEPPGGWPMTAEQAAAAMEGMQQANGGVRPVPERPYSPVSVDVSTQGPTEDDRDRMSARQADIAVGRIGRGLEPVEPQDSISWAESSRMAQEQGIAAKALAIATTVNAEPRALTHVETAGMVDKVIELDNQYEQLVAEMGQANTKGDQGAIKTLSTALSQNQADYDTLTRAIYSSGSEKGRDLASQKLTKGRDFRLASVVARATAAKGAPLTEAEHAEHAADVKALEEAAKAAEPLERQAAETEAANALGLAPESKELTETTQKADTVRKTLTHRRANRIVRSKKGLRRYIGMSEADKDAELQQSLAEAGDEPTAQQLLAIAMNIASRPGVNNVGDVAARMQGYFPDLGQDVLAHAIATATQKGPRTTNALIAKLYETRQEGRTNRHIQIAIQDLIYYLENGEVPEKMVRTVKTPTEAIAALREIKDFYRQQLEISEPARRKKLEEQITILENRIAAKDWLPQPKSAPLPMSEELRQLEAKRDSLRADIAARRKPGPRRYSLMSVEEKEAELQELLARDMSAANIAQIAENVASREGMNTVDDVARAMWPITKLERAAIVDAIVASSQRKVRTTNALVERLHTIKAEAKTIGRLRTMIDDLLGYLDRGEVPAGAEHAIKDQTAAVKGLKDIVAMLRKEIRESEPAQAQRLREQIAHLESRIANQDFAPRPKRQALVRRTPELDRLRYQKARLQHRIRQRIAAMRPQTPWQRVMAPFRFIQSLKSAYDFSAVRRQGGWMVLVHPVRSLRRIPEMFQAFKSEEAAFQINEGIAKRSNAPRYASAGVEFTDPSTPGAFTEREEMFRSEFANRVPGIAASNRAYATFLNLIRADAFDAMSDSFLADGAATQIEDKAIANYVNVTTGRGATGSMKAAADAMNGLFWSPRYVISRFQLVFGQPLYRGTWRTRKAIAKEYARYLAGLVVVYTLGKMAGGELEDDPRSSDFGKIRFGNTRLDPLSGIAQTVTFATRVISGETKRASGEIVPIRGGDVPYGGDNTVDVAARFLRTKLAPAPGMLLDLAAGENVVGEPTTAWGMTKGAAVPLSMSDIYETMQEQGVPAGTALSILAIFGEGVQTYQPKKRHSGKRSLRRRSR